MLKNLTYLFLAVFMSFIITNGKLISQDIKNDINTVGLYDKSGNPNWAPETDMVLGDILQNFNVDTLLTTAVAYGVEWTGNYFVVSAFNANQFWKVRPNWSLQQGPIPLTGGTGSFRDMEFAKGYLWGVSVTNSIIKVDTATWTQVGTIPLPTGIQARALAWDSNRHGFWVSTASFNGFMRLYDTNGVAVASSDINVTNNPGAFYGAAYDNNTPGGPYLIIASDIAPNTVANQNRVKYVRWNIASLPPTRVDSITITIPLIANSGTAGLAHGACDFSTTLIPNKTVIISLAQGTPDRVVVVEVRDITGISGNTNLVPQTFNLSQNYPNPFNPITTFSFGLPKDSDVRLSIIDVLGREVDIITSGHKQAGTYTVNYDASKLSSGVYFYSLITGDYKETKKMLLIK